MIPYLSERENAVEHINTICMRLFHSWCEYRSVTPLVYLLHCWPLMDSHPTTIRRLGDTLSELRKTHLETLDAEAVQVLFELADCVDEILSRASVPDRDGRSPSRQARKQFPVKTNVAARMRVTDAEAHATLAEAVYAAR
jgi:hypothetical protein